MDMKSGQKATDRSLLLEDLFLTPVIGVQVMSQTEEQLFQAALKLSDTEQLQLMSALNAAVQERGLKPFDESWLEEIARRSSEYDAGLVQTASWAEVKEWARQKVLG
jgi:putative addiction module component (TIGR02574 family)